MVSNQDNLGIKINIVSNLVGNYFDKQVKATFPNLTNSQFSILMYLYEHPEQTTSQDQLASNMHTSHPTMRNIIKRMVDKKLVTISAMPVDKRKVQVKLTNDAAAMIKTQYADVKNIVDGTIAKITSGMDANQVQQLNQLLQQIIHNFE